MQGSLDHQVRSSYSSHNIHVEIIRVNVVTERTFHGFSQSHSSWVYSKQSKWFTDDKSNRWKTLYVPRSVVRHDKQLYSDSYQENLWTEQIGQYVHRFVKRRPGLNWCYKKLNYQKRVITREKTLEKTIKYRFINNKRKWLLKEIQQLYDIWK